MKTKYYRIIFFLFFLFPLITTAQQKIVVEEVVKEMSKGTNNGYEFMIPEAMISDIKNDFRNNMRKDSKSKVQEANGEFFIIGAVNKSISPGPFNIYARLKDAGDGVLIDAFFTPDDSLFFSTAVNGEQSIAIKKFLKDFAVKQYKKVVQKQLDTEKRKLIALEDQLEDLIHAKQKSERNINESKRTIENNIRDIDLTTKQIATKDEDIIKQKGIVSSLHSAGADEEKVAQKNLKNMEGDKKKMDKEKESMAKENDKMNDRIANEQRAIENNVKLQSEKNKEIEAQKNKVQKTEEKFNGII
jgi:hypothetical protein